MIPSTIICILGSIGNIIILAILIKNRKYATPDLFYYLIRNLVVYDLLLFFCASFAKVIKSLTLSLGTILCSVCDGFSILFNTGFAMTMVMIAIDRYWVILGDANAILTESRKYLIIIFIFLVALGYAFPIIAFTTFTFDHIQYMKSQNSFTEVITTYFYGLNNNPIFFRRINTNILYR